MLPGGRIAGKFRSKGDWTMTAAEPRIELRPATQADVEPMYPIHRDAMREYVEATWGPWDEVYQQNRFRQNFSIGSRRIIVVDGIDVGFIDVEERADHLWLAEIEIARGAAAPRHRQPAGQRYLDGRGGPALAGPLASAEGESRPPAV